MISLKPSPLTVQPAAGSIAEHVGLTKRHGFLSSLSFSCLQLIIAVSNKTVPKLPAEFIFQFFYYGD